MSPVVISVSNLGKRCRLAHQAGRPRYVALRDMIAEKAKGLFQKRKSANSENRKSENNVSLSASQRVSVSGTEVFRALRDVPFEVKRGDVVLSAGARIGRAAAARMAARRQSAPSAAGERRFCLNMAGK